MAGLVASPKSLFSSSELRFVILAMVASESVEGSTDAVESLGAVASELSPLGLVPSVVPLLAAPEV